MNFQPISGLELQNYLVFINCIHVFRYSTFSHKMEENRSIIISSIQKSNVINNKLGYIGDLPKTLIIQLSSIESECFDAFEREFWMISKLTYKFKNSHRSTIIYHKLTEVCMHIHLFVTFSSTIG